MPVSATITSFYSFTANTKARASQMNTNLSNFRGHMVPIDPNTAACADLTYDLGSTEHRWRSLYSRNVFLGDTTTSWKINDNTTTSQDLIFSKNGVEKMRITNTFAGYTTSASFGQFAMSGFIGAMGYTNTTTPVASSTLTVDTQGKPVRIELVSFGPDSAINLNALTFTGSTVGGQVFVCRDTTTATIFGFQAGYTGPAMTSSGERFRGLTYPVGALAGYDFSATGTHNYFLAWFCDNASSFINIDDAKLMAKTFGT